MSECVWYDQDQELKSLIEAQMGRSSAYTTLKLATIKATLIEGPQDWKEWTLPACAISSPLVAYQDARRHGDGLPHYEKMYRYGALFIVEGNQESAVSQAKTLIKRCEKALRTVAMTVQTSPDGEHTDITKPLIRLAEVRMFRHQVIGTWYGVGVLEFTVKATV